MFVNMKKLIFVASVFFFFSCSPEKEAPVLSESEPEPEPELVVEEVEQEPVEVPKEEIRFPDVTILYDRAPTKAHVDYLDDPMEFLELPDYSMYADTAVVGGENTLFYPGASMAVSADLDNLPEGEVIPLATIIPILSRVENEEKEYSGLFKVDDDYNYFYATRWQGQEGLVFGADLSGVKSTTVEDTITSLIYTTENHFENFPPFTGYRMLTEDERLCLMENRIAFQEVMASEYHLSLEKPDDMLALYIEDVKDKQLPIFITTDLIANTMHLFFDQYLQFVEEDYLFLGLQDLVGGYMGLITEIYQGVPTDDGNELFQDTVAKALAYFQVADALLSLAPIKTEVEDKYGRPSIEYIALDRSMVLEGYPENIRQEVELILHSDGPAISPNFDYREDFSQYKPRGHYTKNGVLEAYFRVMMWFGRIHIHVSTGEDLPLPVEGEDELQSTALDQSIRYMPMAAFLTQLTIDNPWLYESWKALFDPVTGLIGMSDDLSFYEMIPFWKSLGIDNFPVWIRDTSAVREVLNEANKILRQPQISGNSVFFAPSGDEQTSPLGWRLFGQRFTWDSYVHQQVSPPRLMTRDIVRGLDIMTAFGSSSADQLLAHIDYSEMPGLEERLDSLQLFFNEAGQDFWTQTYYNRVLYMIKSQATFEPGSGFYFTETPAWAIKAQLAAHGTWAALRHDTILYVKQVYAEKAGGGDYQPTYRVKALPTPGHYIEPNVNFFEGALSAMIGLSELSDEFNMVDDVFTTRFETWIDLLQRCYEIVKLEYSDKNVDPTDVEWIRTIPQQIVPLVQPPGSGYSSYTDDQESLRSAIIADVFTNAESQVALEIGTGIPYRILVALNDGQGGKRIAQGYTFSYYEFLVPQDERMNNEEWRALVYDGSGQVAERLPFWSREITLPPRE